MGSTPMDTTLPTPRICYQLLDKTYKLPFYQCTVQLLLADHVGKARGYVEGIGFSFIDGVLLLYRDENGFKLYHSCECPFPKYTGETTIDRDVSLAAAVLLKSSDGLILLSRRSKKLKTFPGAWVPPGGHIESGETLEAAALRELEEEVGIKLDQSEYRMEPLCLFESCFPAFIEWGEPKRHHIIIYYLMETTLTKDDLTSRLVLMEAETDACAWLPPTVTKALHDGVTCDGFPPVELAMVQDGVFTSNLQLDPAVFSVQTTGEDVHDVERLSTGTLAALKSFVEQYNTT